MKLLRKRDETMKRTLLISMPALMLALAGMPIWADPPTRYKVTDLGTLGGTYSFAFGINDAGQVAGGAATPDQTDFLAQTAFVWRRGQMTKLGALEGSACPTCSSEGSGVGASGEVAVISEQSKADPNGEDFCAFGTHRQCVGAIWRNGVMTPLEPLPGGNNNVAIWINNMGQMIGWAENDIPDATCAAGTPFQVRQFEPVVWGPGGEIQKRLGPLESKGDTVAFAFGINDHGQAVGTSGLCSNVTLPSYQPHGSHAVLWERDGSVTDLGDLGGSSNIATSINNRGEVVGTARSSKDGLIHSFLWTRQTGMQDLGGFPGALATVAPCCHTINDRGEVVGFSIHAGGNFLALIWRNSKVPTDLNQFNPADSPFLQLMAAQSINNAGEIAGWGLTKAGEIHAFLATPAQAGAAH
jgi:probable HAF family extracellular repeat protein